jgi:hypothetical protein
MSWTPQATVTIGADDFTGETLETIRITRGRDTVFAEPRAGYCICELVDLDGTGLDFQVLDDFSVSIVDSNGAAVPVFTGTISDWTSTLYDTGAESGSSKSVTTVIAVGPLAKLNRRSVAVAGLDAAQDGDRILELVTEGTAVIWEEYLTDTWAQTDPTVTWETIDAGLDPDRIDTPGVFDIAALDPFDGGYNPLTQAYITAISGRGVLFDDAEGFINYHDADRREIAALAGYLNIPKAALNATLQTTQQYSDITNRVSVIFDGGTVRVSDEQSIIEFGVLANEFETNLANQSNAEAWAIDYMEDHAGPIINLTGVGIRLDGPISDQLRDDVIALEVGSPINLEDLPSTLGLTQLPAFVEGIEYFINRETAEVRFNVSDAALSIGSIRWNLVSATLRWTDVNATLTWEDARRLT